MQALIRPPKARKIIQNQLTTNPIESCLLEAAYGRVLAEPIYADRAFPPFNRSMMDGYAASIAEIKGGSPLKISAQAAAGCPQIELATGAESCIEIMTGAVVPQHADCVIPYESTRLFDTNHIEIIAAENFKIGDYIHKKGSDQSQGSEILTRGTRIGSRHAAVLATCGYHSIQVYKQATIAIITTGDELVPVNQTPDLQQIRRSNDHCIQHALTAHHIKESTRSHLADDLQLSRQGLAEQIEHHSVLIISGGVSRGKKDFIPTALRDLGFHCHFHGVAQKPGKPFGFWTLQDRIIFTLPGNPVSSLSCLHAYVLPALDQQMGLQEQARRKMRLTHTLAPNRRLTRFIPIRIERGDTGSAQITQNSGDLIRILASDGFIEVPPNDTREVSSAIDYAYYPWQ